MLQGLRRLRKSEVFTFRTFGVPRGPLNPLHYYCVCCPLGRREFFFEFFFSSRAPRGALNRLQYIDVCCHVGPSGVSRGVRSLVLSTFSARGPPRGPFNPLQYIEVCCHLARSGVFGSSFFRFSVRVEARSGLLCTPRARPGVHRGAPRTPWGLRSALPGAAKGPLRGVRLFFFLDFGSRRGSLGPRHTPLGRPGATARLHFKKIDTFFFQK